ncbi:MAG: methyltransferase domain-containing protein, partial [Patescibacteria group bacterium]
SKGIPVSRDLPPGPYDLIMFWHSLEHTDRPKQVLDEARGLFAPGGKLLIAVPNAASWEARLAGERWFHYDYPFHRVQFTPTAITMLLERIGFRALSIDFFNPEYTVSGFLQTFLNFLFLKNALYTVVSHRRANVSQQKAMFSAMAGLLFLVVFSPLIGAFFILEFIFHKTGAIIVTAERL